MALAALMSSFLTTQSQGVVYPQTKVSAEIEAAPADRSLAQLSAASGVTLKAMPEMRTEILVLRFKDASMQTVMEKIAAVTEGRWVQASAGEYILYPSPALRSASALAQNRKLADEITKSLNRKDGGPGQLTFAPGVASVAVSSQDSRAQESESPEDKKARLMEEAARNAFRSLIRGLGVGSLSAMAPGSRVVYSTRPTVMQRPFSITPGSLQAMLAAHNASAPKPGQVDDESGMDEAMGSMPPEMRELMQSMAGRWKPKPAITTAPYKINMVVERPLKSGGMFGSFIGGMMGQINVKLIMMDQAGKVIYTRAEGLGQADFDFISAMEIDSNTGEPRVPQPKKPEGDQTKLKLSERAVRHGGGMNMLGMMGNGGQMNEKMAGLAVDLAKPDEVDPLALVVGEAALALAKAKNLQLAVCLDEAPNALSVDKDGTTVAAVTDALTKGEMNGSISGDWLTALPADSHAVRRSRIDRSALRRAIEAAKVNGELSLDAAAEFAFNNPYGNESPLLQTYMVFGLRRLMMSSMMQPVSWPWLRFWGSLNPNLRLQIRGGSRMGYGQVPLVSQKILQEMIYGSPGETLQSGPDLTRGPLGTLMPMFGGFNMGGVDNSHLDEPTEAVPNGIAGAAIMPRATTSSALRFLDRSGQASPVLGSMSSLEMSFVNLMMEQDQGQSGFMPDMSRISVGSRSEIRLTVALNQLVRVSTTLVDDSFDPKAPTYTPETLPAKVKAEIAASKKAIGPLAQMFGGMGLPGGGNMKPPL